MFGFGKRKEPEKPSRRSSEGREQRKSQNRAQLGFLAGVSDDGDIDNLMGNMDVGDDDLEEELALILEGKQPAVRRPNVSPPKKPASAPGRTKAAGKPINFDEDNDEMDDDDDIDLDDPELEAELGDILGTPTKSGGVRAAALTVEDDDDDDSEEQPLPAPRVSNEDMAQLLQDRLKMYEDAKQAADVVGDSGKSRRFTRGVKTLKELLSKAKAGRVVDEADIPPAVAIGTIKKEAPQAPPTTSSQIPPPEPIVPVNENDSPSVPLTHKIELPPTPPPRTLLPQPLVPTPASLVPHTPPAPVPVEQPPVVVDPLVEARMKEYKLAAVTLKRQGEVQEALKYLKLSKALENAAKSGETINLSDYPCLQNASNENVSVGPTPLVSEPQSSSSQPAPIVSPAEAPDPTSSTNPPGDDIFGAPPAPKTVMEALEQRLNKYKSEVEKASANPSKARRMGRIVKQYEEAITLYKKGKAVPFDDLPTPPGFAPIPVPSAAVPGPPSAAAEPPRRPSDQTGVVQQPGTPEKKPRTDSSSPSTPGGTGTSPGTPGSTVSRSGKPPTKLTLQEKQLRAITLRQQQFKEAALNAKKRGDLIQAKEFLRTAKGFDKLIQHAQGGLPVDMATLPAPPEAVATLDQIEDDNFEVVSASDCIMPAGGAGEIFSKLEVDLKQQLKMCMRTRDHFKSIGDVASANRFESMALESKRDLDALRLAMKKNSDIPKYHYENRIFSITECNTDVGEDEIDISIVQGISYKVTNPSDVDTFVKIELPYPSAEEAQTNKTAVVKDTNSPTYDANFKMSINRTARNFQRFVHRHGIKCEVWSRGGLCSGGFFFCTCNSGFLRGNTLIGTATVKLLPLETKCTLHDAFDILDGRKVVGKLEVKARVREPVLTKQITQKKEKWLFIDRA